MTPELLRALLARLVRGEAELEEVVDELRRLPFAQLDEARVDHHREIRTGTPEVVFAEGKSADQIVAIARELVAASGRVLVTRLDEGKAAALADAIEGIERYDDARVAMYRGSAAPPPSGFRHVAVVSAGTSDHRPAEEAARTLEFLGIEVRRYRDVGIAGLHRLLAVRDEIEKASVAIVVAGMEGALPSVTAGLIGVPLIAVPTSIGYGASFGGLAALLAMMNACAPGVTVVNIDNGFGAAVAAAAIVRSASRSRGA